MRKIIPGMLAALALVVPATAAASSNDAIVGAELPSADLSTVGNFAGIASGDLPGVWAATVHHEQLVYAVDTPTKIDSGTFTLRERGGATLTIAFDGGSVTPTSLPAGCGSQVFAIVATVGGVQLFQGVLTHYRVRLFGQCIAYAASIAGSATFG